MRVAFHIDQLWFSAPGGIGTYVRKLWFHMGTDGRAEIVPFSSRWRGGEGPPCLAEAGASTPPHFRLPIEVLYPAWSMTRRPHLPRAFGPIDLIHSTNHAAIAPARRGQALVVTVHDLAFDRFPELFTPRWLRLYRRGLSIARNEADLVLVPSAFTATELEGAGVGRDRIRVTPLAADIPVEGEPLAASPYGAPTCCSSERWSRGRTCRGSSERSLRAVRDASLPHQLVLAGPVGWQQDALANELASQGAGRVHVPGRVAQRELEELYRGADAAVYPSLYEGFGLPVLEALAHGRPTLSSSTSSIPEVAGDAALLVDPEDEDAIAAGLIRLLVDTALRDDLMAKGPARAAMFSWAATARATLDAYLEAMEHPHA